jgi:hypothetical protein
MELTKSGCCSVQRTDQRVTLSWGKMVMQLDWHTIDYRPANVPNISREDIFEQMIY